MYVFWKRFGWVWLLTNWWGENLVKWSFNLSVHIIFIDLSFYYGTYFLNSINTPNLPSWQAMFLSLALRWKQNPQTKIHVDVLVSEWLHTVVAPTLFFNFLNNGDISSFLHVECHFPSQIAQITHLRILIHVANCYIMGTSTHSVFMCITLINTPSAWLQTPDAMFYTSRA